MNRTPFLHKPTPWLLVLALCLLIVAGTLCIKLWPRTTPLDQCSVLYQKYFNIPGIKASFVKDYRVNDTLSIDATVLEATTDSAWAMLQNDFGVPKLSEANNELNDKLNSICLWIAPKNNHKSVIDSTMYDSDLVVVSRHTHTISVFHTTAESQIDILWTNNVHELKHPKNEN